MEDYKQKWLAKYCQSVHHYDQVSALLRDAEKDGDEDAAHFATKMKHLYCILCTVAKNRLSKYSKG